MAAEHQLERSVLERKERDELRQIAQAMSLETSARSRKADIIDQILMAAGVEPSQTAGNGASNGTGNGGRSRTRKAAAAAAGGSAAVASPSAAATDATAPLDGTAVDATTPLDSAAKLDSAAQLDGAATTGRTAPDSAARGIEPAPANAGTPAEGARPPGAAGTVAPADSAGSHATGSATTGAAAGVTDAPSTERTEERQGRQHAPQHQVQPQVRHGEPGNRRGNRRRRGRDRAGGERELQGGGQEQSYQGELIPVRGLLDLRDEGYGFLRAEGYLPSSRDVYVSISQARRFALRKGDYVEGACRPASSNEKFPALIRIDSVSGLPPDEARNRPRFEDLTPLFPDSKLKMEQPGSPDNVTARIIDLLAPIGKGQRGLIVSPPKAGKTTIMKQIAHSIEANNPEVHLMVLLVDERPEEVTDMRRSVKGEVVASTFDRPAEEHTQVAELAIERAKRLVELGRDVVIILDGITRLARAYNLAQPATGRIMSGGVDSGALYPPKKFFGAARNIEEGGSLTILATALVETGSKMDEVIFEEFKGTGNMELRLDRRLAERRLYPAIDVNASSTRHEELLFERGQLQQVWKLRRVLNALAADGNAAPGLELLMDKIKTTRSNDEFLAEIAKGPTPS